MFVGISLFKGYLKYIIQIHISKTVVLSINFQRQPYLCPQMAAQQADIIRPRNAAACIVCSEVQCSTCLQWFYFSTSFYHTWHAQGNMCFAKFELLRWNWINWEPKNCFWIILRLKNAFPFIQGMTK